MDAFAGGGFSRDVQVPTLQSVSEAVAPAALRIASINLFFGNRQHARVLEFIRTTQADVVVLIEVTGRWRRDLSPLAEIYPHAHTTREGLPRGVLLLSRRPMAQLELVQFDARAVPALAATLSVSGHPMRIVAVHATWPMGLRNWRLRNRQLLQLAHFVRSSPEPQLAIGDFNITAWSPHFRRLLKEGGLRSAADGWGWQPTWPTFLLPFGLQIDHCLVSPAVHVRHFRRGMAVGSDHRPIIVELDVLPRLESAQGGMAAPGPSRYDSRAATAIQNGADGEMAFSRDKPPQG